MIIPNKVIHKGCVSGSRREIKKVTTFGTKVEFSKMVASGNDFVVVDQRRNQYLNRLDTFASKICDRKYGIGADGLLLLEKSQKADVKMRIFNPDGSEPKMCGNGLRCIGLWFNSKIKNQKSPAKAGSRLPPQRNPATGGKRREKIIRIETKAGIVQAQVISNKVNPTRKRSLKVEGLSRGVRVKMGEPKDVKLDLPIKIVKQTIKANFINTGVPHTVIFVEGLDRIDVVDIGRQVRFYKRFMPEGTNVDFVQIIDDNNIKLRTYERGVENETLACGTGAVASALILAIRYSLPATQTINVHTKSAEILKVKFTRINRKFKNIWLEGEARVVYSGVYYV
jgi:diaminopimelate epimerase